MTSVAVTRDNARVVSGGLDCTVRVFSKKGVDLVCSGHNKPVRDIRIFGEDTKALSCAMDGILKVTNIFRQIIQKCYNSQFHLFRFGTF